MTIAFGQFHPTLVAAGWWGKSAQAFGWFDRNQLDQVAAGGISTSAAASAGATASVAATHGVSVAAAARAGASATAIAIHGVSVAALASAGASAAVTALHGGSVGAAASAGASGQAIAEHGASVAAAGSAGASGSVATVPSGTVTTSAAGSVGASGAVMTVAAPAAVVAGGGPGSRRGRRAEFEAARMGRVLLTEEVERASADMAASDQPAAQQIADAFYDYSADIIAIDELRAKFDELSRTLARQADLAHARAEMKAFLAEEEEAIALLLAADEYDRDLAAVFAMQ